VRVEYKVEEVDATGLLLVGGMIFESRVNRDVDGGVSATDECCILLEEKIGGPGTVGAWIDGHHATLKRGKELRMQKSVVGVCHPETLR
jgi:hypothetical protein